MILQNICLTGMLLANSWTDIRKKQINLPATGAGLIAGILLLVFSRGMSWHRAFSLLTGLLSFAVCFITGGDLGSGDCILILVMGFFLDVEELLLILLLSSVFVVIYIAVSWIRNGGRKDMEIPFIPFLFAGYIAGRFL